VVSGPFCASAGKGDEPGFPIFLRPKFRCGWLNAFAEQEEAPSRRLLGPARACRDGNRTALHARMLSFTALRRLCQQPRVSLGIDLVCSRPAVVVPKLRVARPLPTMVATRRSGSSSSSSSSGSGSTSSEDHCKGAGVKRTPPQPSQARKRKDQTAQSDSDLGLGRSNALQHDFGEHVGALPQFGYPAAEKSPKPEKTKQVRNMVRQIGGLNLGRSEPIRAIAGRKA